MRKKNKLKRILLVCDRSGGHVYPALILARGLERDGVKPKNIYIFCAKKFLKDKIAKFNYRVLGKNVTRGNMFMEGFLRLFEAVAIMFKVRPNVVVGFGGRDSVALVLLAVICGARTSIYEPNVVMGKANRFLAFFVPIVFRGFVDGKDEIFAKKHVFAGVPIRCCDSGVNKAESKRKFGFMSDMPVIGVLGGSQGARFLNTVFIQIAKFLDKDIGIIHLCGREDIHKVRQAYARIGMDVVVCEFFEEMADFYSAIDGLISRAGAMTLGEIIKFRVPSILVPYPGALSHQVLNARYLSDKGGAILVEEKDYQQKKFIKTIHKLIYDEQVKNDIVRNLSDLDITVDGEKFYYNLFIEGLKYEKSM